MIGSQIVLRLVAVPILLTYLVDDRTLQGSPANQFAKLKFEYDKDLESAKKAFIVQKNSTFADGPTKPLVSPDKFVPQLLELGRSKDEATAVSALSLVVFGWPKEPDADKALDVLLSRFAASDRLIPFVNQQYSSIYPGQEEHLTRLVCEAKLPLAVCVSCLKMGMLLDDNFVPYAFLNLSTQKSEERRGRALRYYRRVVSEFPKIEDGRLALKAGLCITQLQKLRVGLPAPAIEGMDLAGRPMSLKEFNNRIVVLDFWGSWCAPCRRKLPMMKSLSEKYEKRGVVFLGVMAEKSIDDAVNAVKKDEIPWRNWIDLRGAKDESAIVQEWGVAAFPSVFVLDGAGKIRFTHAIEKEELERAIDFLLSEKGGIPPGVSGQP